MLCWYFEMPKGVSRSDCTKVGLSFFSLMLTNSCIKVVDDVDFDCLTVLGFCMPHIRHHVSCLKMFFLFLGTAPKFYNPHNWYSTFSVFGWNLSIWVSYLSLVHIFGNIGFIFHHCSLIFFPDILFRVSILIELCGDVLFKFFCVETVWNYNHVRHTPF